MSANAIPGVIATPASSAHVAVPAVPAAPVASPATAGSIGGAVFALVVVIGLILALAWLAKRMPGLGGASNPALRIVGSLALGPRERLVVVAVGDTQLLLGVGAGGTRTLHTLDRPLPVAGQATPAFAQLLAQHFGKKA
ncbi:MAG TPA: flagellar biosynthetic protein FliO [Lysobacter sp.]